MSVHFDLNDDIYVGGLPAHMYRLAAKSLLKARDGFHGCLASLRLNGPSRDLLDGSFQLPPHATAFITPRCDGKKNAFVVCRTNKHRSQTDIHP